MSGTGKAARRAGRPRGSVRVLGPLLLALGLLLGGAACGTNAQTSQPYTPAEGVNVDVGDSANPAGIVHVRNLAIISTAPGQGILSGTLSSYEKTSLTAVSGASYTVEGVEGAPIKASLAAPVEVIANSAVVLTAQQPLIQLTGADLAPGLQASLELQFSTAGQTKVNVPVVDGKAPQYATITPGPSASASASSSAAPSASPSPSETE